MTPAMLARVSGETSSDAIWHNRIPVASDEPALDIDRNPNLLHKYAQNAGTKIHYVTMGSSQKPLMVFVHGFPDFWYSWRNQLQTFSANYQVLALDLRGYDLSDRPEGVENYKFPVLLDDIRAVVNAEANGRKGHPDWARLGRRLVVAVHRAKSGPGRKTRSPQRSSSWRHHERIAPLEPSNRAVACQRLRHTLLRSRQRRSSDCAGFGLLGRQSSGQESIHRSLREIFHLVDDELLQSQLRVVPACAQSFRSNHEETLRRRDQMPGLALARTRGEPRLAEHY